MRKSKLPSEWELQDVWAYPSFQQANVTAPAHRITLSVKVTNNSSVLRKYNAEQFQLEQHRDTGEACFANSTEIHTTKALSLLLSYSLKQSTTVQVLPGKTTTIYVTFPPQKLFTRYARGGIQHTTPHCARLQFPSGTSTLLLDPVDLSTRWKSTFHPYTFWVQYGAAWRLYGQRHLVSTYSNRIFLTRGNDHWRIGGGINLELGQEQLQLLAPDSFLAFGAFGETSYTLFSQTTALTFAVQLETIYSDHQTLGLETISILGGIELRMGLRSIKPFPLVSSSVPSPLYFYTSLRTPLGSFSQAIAETQGLFLGFGVGAAL